MAVTVQLEYESVYTERLHKVKIKFFNGGPNLTPSTNTVGNVLSIYDKHGSRHWLYNGVVKYTSNDYLWSEGTPFEITALVWMLPGTDNTFYVKTNDVDDLYEQFYAVSNEIVIKAGDISATAIAATKDSVTIDFDTRNPNHENICLDDTDGNLIFYDNIYESEDYWIKQNVLEMTPNSRRELTYGLATPTNEVYVFPPKTIEIATLYTQQVQPEFTVSVSSNNIWTISWPGTMDPNYPSGGNVYRTDIIEIYNRSGDPYVDELIFTKSGLDFTKSGRWSFSFSGTIKIVLACNTDGLWDYSCIDTVYRQVLSSRLYYDATNYEQLTDEEITTIIHRVNDKTIGYVKLDKQYHRITNAFVKIEGRYVPIEVMYFKRRGRYYPWRGTWEYDTD